MSNEPNWRWHSSSAFSQKAECRTQDLLRQLLGDGSLQGRPKRPSTRRGSWIARFCYLVFATVALGAAIIAAATSHFGGTLSSHGETASMYQDPVVREILRLAKERDDAALKIARGNEAAEAVSKSVPPEWDENKARATMEAFMNNQKLLVPGESVDGNRQDSLIVTPRGRANHRLLEFVPLNVLPDHPLSIPPQRSASPGWLSPPVPGDSESKLSQATISSPQLDEEAQFDY
jgi:hypothetical protein